MKRLLAAAAIAAFAAGCGGPLKAERLSPSFAESFAGLYATQQKMVGRIDVDHRALQADATCRRTGPQPDGAGDDWICIVRYVDHGASASQQYEVQVKPDGCWKAEGLPSQQPARLENTLTGKRFTNPLAEFDGCFDPSPG